MATEKFRTFCQFYDFYNNNSNNFHIFQYKTVLRSSKFQELICKINQTLIYDLEGTRTFQYLFYLICYISIKLQIQHFIWFQHPRRHPPHHHHLHSHHDSHPHYHHHFPLTWWLCKRYRMQANEHLILWNFNSG